MKKLLWLTVCGLMLAGCQSIQPEGPALTTPDDALFVTIDLQVKPEMAEEFLAVMIEAAPDTRNWEGCLLFDIYVDQRNPGHILFYEIWSSAENQRAYLRWRAESGFNASIGKFMAPGGTGVKTFTKVDG